MPNHVTNIVAFLDVSQERVQEILEAIKHDEEGIGTIDFEKIIPMPDYIYRGSLGVEEEKRYGKNNWYDWSVENWGTKWNAYDFAPYDPGRNAISFHTAWSAPEPVIRELSKKFPDVYIRHSWADEDIGMNTGVLEYKAGEVTLEYIPPCPSAQSYELATRILGVMDM